MDPKKTSVLSMWAMAQSVTITAGILTYPLDTVRVRLQADAARDKPMYTNAFDCIQKMMEQEGLRAFYRGQLFRLVQGTGGAFALVFYDKLISSK